MYCKYNHNGTIMSLFTSSNGTVFCSAVYIKTGIHIKVLTTLKDPRPVGIIIKVAGHGEWIYINGTVSKKNYIGLPQLLEVDVIEKYIYTLQNDKADETRKQLFLALWDAHGMMEQIFEIENCGCGRPKRQLSRMSV